MHSPKCGSGNRPISKQGALALLCELLAPGAEGERLYRELRISPAPDRLSAGAAHLLDEPAAAVQAPEATSEYAAIRGQEAWTGNSARNPAAQAAFSHSSAERFSEQGMRGAFPARETNATPAGADRGNAFFPAAQTAPPLCPPQPADAFAAHLPLTPPQHFVVFDVETRRSAAEVGGWHRAGQMGVSVAVVYDSKADDYFSHSQEDLPALFERLRAADLVVGFNSLRFDYAVLAPFATFELRSLPGLDLLQRVHERLNYRVSLNNLGQATLGEPKSADGMQALQWWKEGRCEEIAAYCRKDVDLTRRLYLFGLTEGYLLFSNKAGQRVRLPWTSGHGHDAHAK